MDNNSFYQKNSAHWAKQYETGSNPALLLRNDYAVEAARQQKAARLLDAGCGTGELIASLTEAGFFCDGMDCSKDMLALARQRQSDAYAGNIGVGDMCSLQTYPDSSYDLIISYGTFVHDIDESKTLAAFYEKLNPGGRIILSFRNQLFSLFSQNEYTKDFYQSLLAPCALESTVQAQALEYLLGDAGSRLDLRPQAAAHKAVFTKFHNPLAITESLATAGFLVEDRLYLNMHPLPPAFRANYPEWEREAIRLQAAVSRSWEGNFLASQFLIQASKASDSVK